MTEPRPPRRGTRRTELISTVSDTPIEIPVEEPTPEQDGGLQPEEQLVFAGDVVTAGSTLAVIMPGDTKESYFSFKHATHVQEGEDATEVYSRVATMVTQGVVGMIDDAHDAMAAYEANLRERGLIQ